TALMTLSLKVLPEKITTKTLPAGVVGQVYPATTLTKIGGGTAVTWTIASGHLPPGLVLSTGGQITGTPTTAGSFVVRIRVQPSNVSLSTPTASRSFTVVITAP